jgi:hypothetical protein
VTATGVGAEDSADVGAAPASGDVLTGDVLTGVEGTGATLAMGTDEVAADPTVQPDEQEARAPAATRAAAIPRLRFPHEAVIGAPRSPCRCWTR